MKFSDFRIPAKRESQVHREVALAGKEAVSWAELRRLAHESSSVREGRTRYMAFMAVEPPRIYERQLRPRRSKRREERDAHLPPRPRYIPVVQIRLVNRDVLPIIIRPDDTLVVRSGR